MPQNNEYLDITQLEQINAVQSIRNAETLDDALRVMNGLAANGWLKLWDSATHPDGTSWRDKSPISQNEQQEAGSTLEDWLTINMPSGTFIGDPLWWARKIRNVLAFTENNKQAIPAVNVSVPYELLKRIMDNSEEIIFNDFVHVAVQFEIFSDLEDIFDNAAPTTSLTSETNTEVGE